MKNLEKISGLPISVDDDGKIEFREPLFPVAPQSRTLAEMRPVLLEQEIVNAENAEKNIYDVYRTVNLREDEKLFKDKNIRYDITIVHPGLLGEEFSKTFGHFHENGYPEVFEVLSGRAFWLLQNYDASPTKIKRAILVEAGEGEKAIMLPGFGHVSVNPEPNQKLVISNFIATNFENNYEIYTKLRGACYYIISKNGEFEFVANPNYKEVPALIRARPKQIPEIGIVWSKPLYSLVENPEHLSFLSSSDKFSNLLTFENCYELI